MPIRDLRPLVGLALGVGDFFSSAAAASASSEERFSGVRNCFPGTISSASASSSAGSFYTGRSTSASGAAGCLFAGASSSARSAAGSSESLFASSLRRAAGRLLHTSVHTKNGFKPGPKHITAIAVLAAASCSMYMYSTSEKATNDPNDLSQYDFDDETKEMLVSYRIDKFFEAEAVYKKNHDCIPESIDWVKSGAVKVVKKQGGTDTCSMCAVLAAIESKHLWMTNEAVDLSLQHIIDCSGYGCGGGNNVSDILAFMTSEGCIKTAHYPFTGKCGKCKSSQCPVSVQVNGYFTMTATEERLKFAVSMQPTVVTVYCSKKFHNFKGGRTLELTDCQIDGEPDPKNTHAVVVVGYGEDKDGLFWLIQNSWGRGWGDRGFAKLRRGVTDSNGRGVAGITSEKGGYLCYLPVLDGANFCY